MSFPTSHHKLVAFCGVLKNGYKQKPNQGSLVRTRHLDILKEIAQAEYERPASFGSLHKTILLDMPEVIHYTYSEEEVSGEEYSIMPTAISEVSSWSV